MRCVQHPWENDVKVLTGQSKTIPPHDYQPALQGALSWLGKRYLLAEPLNRRGDSHQNQASKPQQREPAPISAISC